MKIKFCGIRREEDALFLNEFPPDYAGFVFAPSRRRITPEQAAALRDILLPQIKTVGVFVNAPLEELARCTGVISVWQLHGDEDENYINELRDILPENSEIWKAVRVRSADDITEAAALPADMLLLDAFSHDAAGGTGKTFDHSVIEQADIGKPFFLAGGIDISNIGDIIGKISPHGIDISSGIETDGAKDRSKIEAIMNFLRKA